MTKDETGKTTNPEAKLPKQESESETPKKQETKTTSGTSKGSALTRARNKLTQMNRHAQLGVGHAER